MKIKEDLKKKKTPEEKKAFYVEQKVNRQAEDQEKQRTFSSAVGSVEESKDVSSLWEKHVADPATTLVLDYRP